MSFEVKRLTEETWVANWWPVLNILVPTLNFWSHWWPMSHNFEPCHFNNNFTLKILSRSRSSCSNAKIVNETNSIFLQWYTGASWLKNRNLNTVISFHLNNEKLLLSLITKGSECQITLWVTSCPASLSIKTWVFSRVQWSFSWQCHISDNPTCMWLQQCKTFCLFIFFYNCYSSSRPQHPQDFFTFFRAIGHISHGIIMFGWPTCMIQSTMINNVAWRDHEWPELLHTKKGIVCQQTLAHIMSVRVAFASC